MPISDSHVGRAYPSSAPYLVTASKIAEFAAALGDANEHYAGPDAIAPPTFAAVIAAGAWGALFDDAELGLSLDRTIHYDQRFAFDRSLRVGDEVTSTLSIEKVVTRGATEFVTVAVDIATVAGEHVARATSTLLHTREENR